VSWTRWGTAILAVLGAAAIVGLGPAAPAQPTDTGAALLDAARTADAHQTYAGTLTVDWRDHGHLLERHAAARVVDGVVEVDTGNEQVLSEGGQRWVGSGGRWSLVLGPDTGTPAAPRPDAHWDLRTVPGPDVAGQPTTLVVAADPRTGSERARYFIDRSSGRLLRRDVLGASGEVEREVTFDQLVPLAATTRPLEPARADVKKPTRVAATPSGYSVRGALGRGYRLLGRYRQPDGTLQLYYGDGLFTLSLFEQRGAIDWGSLPAGSEQMVHGVPTRRYDTPTGTAVVWAAHGVVVTCVGDAPPDQLMLAVHDVVGGGATSSVLQDIAHFVLGPFGWNS
jgi:negative regulator of sigma E activity